MEPNEFIEGQWYRYSNPDLRYNLLKYTKLLQKTEKKLIFIDGHEDVYNLDPNDYSELTEIERIFYTKD
jgi:hypothetical protein